MRRAIGLAITTLLFALALSCGGDEGTDPESSSLSLLDSLVSSYAHMDSVRYGSLLDSLYWFELLPEDVVPDSASGWNRAAELRIAGRMFHMRYAPDERRFLGVGLDLRLKSVEIDFAAYDGKPSSETWYRMIAAVDVHLVVEDPHAADQSGITNYVVDSDQIFVLRPDPLDEERFLIVRQIDRPSPWMDKRPSGTVDISWGALKKIWW
jgi:hypothetical protein